MFYYLIFSFCLAHVTLIAAGKEELPIDYYLRNLDYAATTGIWLDPENKSSEDPYLEVFDKVVQEEQKWEDPKVHVQNSGALEDTKPENSAKIIAPRGETKKDSLSLTGQKLPTKSVKTSESKRARVDNDINFTIHIKTEDKKIKTYKINKFIADLLKIDVDHDNSFYLKNIQNQKVFKQLLDFLEMFQDISVSKSFSNYFFLETFALLDLLKLLNIKPILKSVADFFAEYFEVAGQIEKGKKELFALIELLDEHVKVETFLNVNSLKFENLIKDYSELLAFKYFLNNPHQNIISGPFNFYRSATEQALKNFTELSKHFENKIRMDKKRLDPLYVESLVGKWCALNLEIKSKDKKNTTYFELTLFDQNGNKIANTKMPYFSNKNKKLINPCLGSIWLSEKNILFFSLKNKTEEQHVFKWNLNTNQINKVLYAQNVQTPYLFPPYIILISQLSSKHTVFEIFSLEDSKKVANFTYQITAAEDVRQFIPLFFSLGEGLLYVIHFVGTDNSYIEVLNLREGTKIELRKKIKDVAFNANHPDLMPYFRHINYPFQKGESTFSIRSIAASVIQEESNPLYFWKTAQFEQVFQNNFSVVKKESFTSLIKKLVQVFS